MWLNLNYNQILMKTLFFSPQQSKDNKKKLDIKEHPDRGVYVKDLSLVPCHNSKDMDNVMNKGSQNRSVGATLMNADSSR